MPKKGCTGPQRMDKGHSLDSWLGGRLYCSFHFLVFVNFKSLFKRLILYVCFCVWICAHECRCPQGSEEGIGSPELELQVIDSCWEPNSGLRQEQQALRTHESSVLPMNHVF